MKSIFVPFFTLKCPRILYLSNNFRCCTTAKTLLQVVQSKQYIREIWRYSLWVSVWTLFLMWGGNTTAK